MDNSIPWLIPIAPLVAAVLCTAIAFLQPKNRFAHIPAWIGLAVSAICALILISRIGVDDAGVEVDGYRWLEIGQIYIPITLQLDAVSLVQICVVTFVAALVGFYSAGYMRGDAGYARFFAVFSGFVFSMCMLVLTNNLLVLYMFWEGVGLCSYLLIGYWYTRPSAAQAATKAFLVNRVADTGFLLGILVLWNAIGSVAEPGVSVLSRLDYQVIFSHAEALARAQPGVMLFVAAMLLIGAIGKSAQFPLHVWLPDAMEGPTPVSALIHAATMVTAGVYLMCRMAPLLVWVPEVLVFAAWLGGITALLGALIALFQDDLKRVLAYSTVSQLGYMFMAIGCGAKSDLMSAAVMAALFHVATHAFFKALLFLSAGNVMHSMGDVIDMREFSGLRRLLPKTFLLFGIGAATLAGIPLLSGFWSKDGILGLLYEASQESDYASSFSILLAVGLVTAFLTSLYTFRAFFRTFYGVEKFPKAAGEHPHESPLDMLWPLGILAVGSVGLGVAIGPTGMLTKYLHHIPHLGEIGHPEHATWLLLLSSVIALAGCLLAWNSVMGNWSLAAMGSVGRSLSRAGQNRFYFDEFYRAILVAPLMMVSHMFAAIDTGLIDAVWRQVVRIPEWVGGPLRAWQSGRMANYSAAMAVGLIVYVVIVIFG